ncbi:hypothetical protein [Mastigocoleus testarum]|uniref:Uncharacterized protein n=1 Tax=Mastigocoleus testarum BC008 TaxID=371196 RepID=A0A0V7ZYJ0_9CYAN|nr:hypothetical protein [Mastigocoleus testarum]KST69661.1 hypothetical protein BC008_04980 [Mastigocoleus testarum BC008]KST69714.1 hypothetical protein BC008_05300 [Mastigocoleus testarum BC008]
MDRSIIDHIKSGKLFVVYFKQGINNIGTLKAGTSYEVIYENRGFVTYGQRVGEEDFFCYIPGYSNANINKNEISLWNAIFTFDENKKIYYQGRIIGNLELDTKYIPEWWVQKDRVCKKREKHSQLNN